MNDAALVSALLGARLGQAQLAVAGRMLRINGDTAAAAVKLVAAAQQSMDRLANVAAGIGTSSQVCPPGQLSQQPEHTPWQHTPAAQLASVRQRAPRSPSWAGRQSMSRMRRIVLVGQVRQPHEDRQATRRPCSGCFRRHRAGAAGRGHPLDVG